jgi:hypothetical protein
MASNLECLGLAAVDDFWELVAAARAQATSIGRRGSIEVLRWQDASGVRLTLGFEGDELASFLPSFAGESTTRLANVRGLNDEVFIAAVVDDAGEQLTSLAVELEQQPLIANPITSALATITFLGRHITVHDDPDAFAASDASLLRPGSDPNDSPPARVAEHGLKWPVRMGHESFLSYGAFGDPSDAVASARFAALVVSAERRTVSLTGQSFIVAQVETIGICASLCLKGPDFAVTPTAGQVVAGEVFVSGSLVDLEDTRPSRRLLRGKPAKLFGRR